MIKKMLNDRVLVKPLEDTDTSSGGIQLVTKDAEKPVIAEVVMGSETGSISTGEKVMYGAFSGILITMQDTQYCIIQEKDIFAIL